MRLSLRRIRLRIPRPRLHQRFACLHVVPTARQLAGRDVLVVALAARTHYFHYSFGYRLGSFSESWTYNEVAFTFGAAWNFWMLEDKLALYPKLDLSYRIGSVSGDIGSMAGYGGMWIQGTGGVMYRTGNVTLRAELGSGSLRLGAGLTFF